MSDKEVKPNFAKGDGLIPVIAQDYESGVVLMLAYMNEESYNETLKTGRAVYFSRSRQKLWRKGEESGNVQWVKDIFIDCDEDTILLKVDQIGKAACKGLVLGDDGRCEPFSVDGLIEIVLDPHSRFTHV